MTQPISGLGLGVTGPYVRLEIIISGALLLAHIMSMVS